MRLVSLRSGPVVPERTRTDGLGVQSWEQRSVWLRAHEALQVLCNDDHHSGGEFYDSCLPVLRPAVLQVGSTCNPCKLTLD
jgi:hypothetical protein